MIPDSNVKNGGNLDSDHQILALSRPSESQFTMDFAHSQQRGKDFPHRPTQIWSKIKILPKSYHNVPQENTGDGGAGLLGAELVTSDTVPPLSCSFSSALCGLSVSGEGLAGEE
jgi:hypothetical protein